MAKQRFGINDAYRGTVGTVIGYEWRGRWCLRSRPRRVANPRTEAQQEHRQLFRDMVRLASRMLPALRKGLHEASREVKMTEGNLFVKMNKGCFTPRGIVYESLAVSAGPVAPVAFTQVELDDEGVLHARFEKNPLHLQASGDDEVRLYAFCPSLGQGCLSTPVYRRSKRVDMVLPDQWEGLEVHFYGFVTDYQQRASETIYFAVNTHPCSSRGEGTECEAFRWEGTECEASRREGTICMDSQREGEKSENVGAREELIAEEGLDQVEGEGPVDGVVAHLFAAQGAEEGSAAEGFSQVACQGADVGAFAAVDAEVGLRQV